MHKKDDPNIKYEPSVIVMCQCKFTYFKKYSILVRGVDNGEYPHVMYEIVIPFA